MAKIDTTSIEGYDSLSAEEKVKALESFSFAEPDYSGYVKKDVFDKTASELASAKKELKKNLSEEDARKAEETERIAELQSKYETLLKESEMTKSKAKYLALGYSEELADKAAKAFTEGDTEILFGIQKEYLESYKKKVQSEMMAGNPKPVADGSSVTMTLENFRKLSPSERFAYSQSHPEEYATLYKNQ